MGAVSAPRMHWGQAEMGTSGFVYWRSDVSSFVCLLVYLLVCLVGWLAGWLAVWFLVFWLVVVSLFVCLRLFVCLCLTEVRFCINCIPWSTVRDCQGPTPSKQSLASLPLKQPKLRWFLDAQPPECCVSINYERGQPFSR